MNRKLLASLLFICASWPGDSFSRQNQSRSYSLALQDQSPIESPIKASGTVNIREEQSSNAVSNKVDFDIRFKNASLKPIVAYDVLIVVTSEHGPIIRHRQFADFFFRKELELAPGADDMFQLELPGVLSEPRRTGVRDRANVEATFDVEFVEFADGTTYGSSTWGNALHQARQAAIQQMKASVEEFQAHGNDGVRASLGAAITRPDNLKHTTDVLRGIRQTLETDGGEAAVSEMTRFIVAAETRRNLM